VNVIGNAVAAVAVAKWDGEFNAQLWAATSPSRPSGPVLNAVPGASLAAYTPTAPGKPF
jgi:hypothetical protein